MVRRRMLRSERPRCRVSRPREEAQPPIIRASYCGIGMMTWRVRPGEIGPHADHHPEFPLTLALSPQAGRGDTPSPAWREGFRLYRVAGV